MFPTRVHSNSVPLGTFDFSVNGFESIQVIRSGRGSSVATAGPQSQLHRFWVAEGDSVLLGRFDQ